MAADRCAECGVATVPTARFCHSCGVRLDVTVVELDVLSETRLRADPAEPKQPPASRFAPLLLAVVVAFGAVAVVLFTSDGEVEPPADSPEIPLDEATTEEAEVETEPVDSDGIELVAAPGLDWTPGPELGGVWPLAFVEYDGSHFFFATGPISPFGNDGEGMWAWRSVDGREWSALGPVMDPPNAVNAVIAGSEGLIAVGVDGERAPVVWSSGDGVGWDIQPLPLDLVPDGASAEPVALASSGDLTVIVGNLKRRELNDVVGQAVAASFALDMRLYGIDFNSTSTPLTVRILGPFGLELAEFTAVELGLSEAELAGFREVRSAPVTTVWSSTDGRDWRTANLDSYYANSVAAVTDGGVVITGFGSGLARAGSGALVSVDGLEWSVERSGEVSSVVRWGAAIVGVANEGGARLRVSRTGVDWDTVSMGDLLPEGPMWYVSRVAAGERGIAALADALGNFEPVPAPTAAIVKDGFTLFRGSRELIILELGVERLRILPYSRVDERYRVDLAEGVVVFMDPETAEPLVTVTIDELRELELLADPDPESDSRQIILTSADARQWSLSAVSDFTDGTAFVGALGVGDTTVTAAVATISSPAAWREETPSIQLFTADLAS